MISRALGVLALAVSVGMTTHPTAPTAVPAAATTAKAANAPLAEPRDSRARLQAAVEAASLRHVPGAAGSRWILQRLDDSAPRVDGSRRIVATGVIARSGAPDTRVRLSGRYDPATGRISRVAYRLQPSEPAFAQAAIAVADDAEAGGWNVQQAVQRALSQAMPGKEVRFALGSAQSLRLEDGGRRFEGVGIGHWDGGDGRFVAFTLALSPDGDQVSFAFGMPSAAEQGLPVLAQF